MDSTTINYKADFEAVAHDFRDKICLAAEQGERGDLSTMLGTRRELKELGRVDHALNHANIKLENKEGKPLAHIVAEKGYKNLIETLYTKYVELDGKYKDKTPSELAIENGHRECAEEIDKYVDLVNERVAKGELYKDALGHMNHLLKARRFHDLY